MKRRKVTEKKKHNLMELIRDEIVEARVTNMAICVSSSLIALTTPFRILRCWLEDTALVNSAPKSRMNTVLYLLSTYYVCICSRQK